MDGVWRMMLPLIEESLKRDFQESFPREALAFSRLFLPLSNLELARQNDAPNHKWVHHVVLLLLNFVSR